MQQQAGPAPAVAVVVAVAGRLCPGVAAQAAAGGRPAQLAWQAGPRQVRLPVELSSLVRQGLLQPVKLKQCSTCICSTRGWPEEYTKNTVTSGLEHDIYHIQLICAASEHSLQNFLIANSCVSLLLKCQKYHIRPGTAATCNKGMESSAPELQAAGLAVHLQCPAKHLYGS